MQIELSFIFPHVLKELPVQIFIPLPEQRPRTVAHLMYMCSGQIPPLNILNAFQLSPADIAYDTPEAAKAAGVLPFSDTSVVRIEKDAMMEIGSSTTKTIFGGFIPEEPCVVPSASAARGCSIAASMTLLKAGTILYGNLGFPNSNASRYYLLLANIEKPAQQKELDGFAPLGMVTSGMAELQKAITMTAINPRSLEPKKKVIISSCDMRYELSSHLSNGNEATPSQQRSSEAVTRVAGRVRRRDHDEEEEDLQRAEVEAEDGNANGTASTSSGFFHLSARFPKAIATAAAQQIDGGRAMKRRRAEALVMGEDGRPELRTTAIAPGERGSASESFDFFSAQEDAFLNDIESIHSTQAHRKRQHERKARKQQYHSLSRAAKTSGSKRGSSGATSATSATSQQRRAGAKVVRRRY